jgi:hypothetical protein
MSLAMMRNDEILDLLSDAVKAGSGVRLAVSGRSMGLAYASVFEVQVVPCEHDSIFPGRLVVFQRHGCWVVHRVMRRMKREGGSMYLTKGDGLPMPDDPLVQASEIRGVVARAYLRDGSEVDLMSFPSSLHAIWLVVRYWIGRFITQTGKVPGLARQG